ncbi:MAG: Rho termination factor N-terminal domain-containing protein [Bacteroidales bacterium]|nr:Rho termination factor N-terminal domain-containing protein [Bacteroidales bacterium]
MYDIIELNGKLVNDLKEIAKTLEINGIEGLKKQDLIYKILDHQSLQPTEINPTQKEHSEKKTRARRRKPKVEKVQKITPSIEE